MRLMTGGMKERRTKHSLYTLHCIQKHYSLILHSPKLTNTEIDHLPEAKQEVLSPLSLWPLPFAFWFVEVSQSLHLELGALIAGQPSLALNQWMFWSRYHLNFCLILNAESWWMEHEGIFSPWSFSGRAFSYTKASHCHCHYGSTAEKRILMSIQ